MKVIVGSRDLGLSVEIVSAIAALFSELGPGEGIGVRVAHGEDMPASPVERLAEGVARKLHRPVIRFSPSRGGRAATFRRDYDLVEGADHVIAFFSPEREMDGGTGHVVKAALDRDVKVEAYGVGEDGTLLLLGSDEGVPPHALLTSAPEALRRMWEEIQSG